MHYNTDSDSLFLSISLSLSLSFSHSLSLSIYLSNICNLDGSAENLSPELHMKWSNFLTSSFWYYQIIYKKKMWEILLDWNFSYWFFTLNYKWALQRFSVLWSFNHIFQKIWYVFGSILARRSKRVRPECKKAEIKQKNIKKCKLLENKKEEWIYDLQRRRWLVCKLYYMLNLYRFIYA